jgi:hypothetical protein
MSDAARQEMARCLRSKPSAESAATRKLDLLLHRHLWEDAPRPSRCTPFPQVAPSEEARTCLRDAGAVRWTADGLQQVNGTASCGDRRWLGTADARCLLAGRDVLFVGNSVVRRQMFTLLDILAGRAAHRLLPNGTSVDLRSQSGSVGGGRSDVDANGAIASRLSTRLWDLDGHEHGYHAAQLFTVDLTTGEHRLCARSHAQPAAQRVRHPSATAHAQNPRRRSRASLVPWTAICRMLSVAWARRTPTSTPAEVRVGRTHTLRTRCAHAAHTLRTRCAHAAPTQRIADSCHPSTCATQHGNGRSHPQRRASAPHGVRASGRLANGGRSSLSPSYGRPMRSQTGAPLSAPSRGQGATKAAWTLLMCRRKARRPSARNRRVIGPR